MIENICPHCSGRTHPVIEERVLSLVATLNGLPGVYTFSSCGGHENPTEIQEEAGSFSVDFFVDIEEGGWLSLRRLAFAINMIQSGAAYDHFDERSMPEEWPEIMVKAWWNGEEEVERGELDFSLKGSVVDPDFLARTLEAVARGEFVESHD